MWSGCGCNGVSGTYDCLWPPSQQTIANRTVPGNLPQGIARRGGLAARKFPPIPRLVVSSTLLNGSWKARRTCCNTEAKNLLPSNLFLGPSFDLSSYTE